MSEYREFQGKTLDEAIRDACSFYDAPREKLEIDIVSDAKGGIFGLVGVRKALIKARRVELGSVLDDLDAPVSGAKKNGSVADKKRRDDVDAPPARPAAQAAPATQALPVTRSAVQTQPAGLSDQPEAGPVFAEASTGTAGEAAREQGDTTPRRERQAAPKRGRDGRRNAAPASEAIGAESQNAEPVKQPGKDREGRDARSRRDRSQNRGKAGNAPTAADISTGGATPAGGRRRERSSQDAALDKNASFSGGSGDMADAGGDELPRIPFDQLDATELLAVTREVIARLTVPLLGEVPFEATCASDRVRVSISGLEDPGLLIGRDGQTLSSLQYLATRMVSNRLKALVRVQIDAGDYRERQDERLRELALALAEKVKAGGRSQLTRPLSSYHRRVIHMTLQDDSVVQTHSKGEGEMKRVVVALRHKQEKPA